MLAVLSKSRGCGVSSIIRISDTSRFPCSRVVVPGSYDLRSPTRPTQFHDTKLDSSCGDLRISSCRPGKRKPLVFGDLTTRKYRHCGPGRRCLAIFSRTDRRRRCQAHRSCERMDGVVTVDAVSPRNGTFWRRVGTRLAHRAARDNQRIDPALDSPALHHCPWNSIWRRRRFCRCSHVYFKGLGGEWPPWNFWAGSNTMTQRKRSIRAVHRTACGATALVLISLAVIAAFPTVAKAQESAAPSVAFETLMRLAEQGNSVAQNNLGLRYAQGDGTEQDNGEALRWYLRAAEQGLPEAQNNVGLMYAEGLGAPRNDFEAVRWYRLSALQEFAVAQNNLGWMYDQGRGVERNYEEAARWYRRSAEQALPNAQFNLAAMYEAGFGVDQDLSEAVRWYRKAADQQHEQALARVRLLEPGLPSSDATSEAAEATTPDPTATAELPAASVAPVVPVTPVVPALPVVPVTPIVPAAPQPLEETALASIPSPPSVENAAKKPTVVKSKAVSAASAAPSSETTSNAPKEIQAAGNYQAQLAAYRSEERSLNGWRAMVAAYPSQFEGFSPSIERIDLGGAKGVFFRLMTGHFGTVDEAKRFCTRIVQSGAASGCIPRPTQ